MTGEVEQPRSADSPAGHPQPGSSGLRRIAIVAYGATGIVSLIMGTIYVTASQFLPYHQDAIGDDWQTLDTGTQAVLRALVHVGGGGWLACGVALLVMTAIPVRRGERWAMLFVPIIGLLFWIPTLWATIEVTARTQAAAPWYGSAVAVALLVIGITVTAIDEVRP